ncbi:hypothetical protein [Streptomyces sp. NPDC050564]|uniref:hypothetical protein n=1 Tax=Streptomyces sp. NPDC050564 TaxID=3365631 RepID=UPI0037B79634
MNHTIRIEPEFRGHGRCTYSYRCSCGAYGYGSRSRGAAEAAGREHQRKQGVR